MRLFLSIEPDEAARRALRRVQRRIIESDLASSFRLSPADQLHLTMKFIGEWDERRLPELVDAVRQVRFTPIHAVLADLEPIPSPLKPRVLAVGVEPREELSSLAGRIEEAVHAIGVPLEARGFRPHITIARQRGGARSSGQQLRSIVESVGRIGVGFPVESLSLVQSQLSSSGAVHTELWRLHAA